MAAVAETISCMCPRCQGQPLASRMTRQGVEVDLCLSCGGVWLDRGEIFLFARNRRSLETALKLARLGGREGPLKSPKTGRTMTRFNIGRLELDTCPDTQGIWFDKGELERLSEAGIDLMPVTSANPSSREAPPAKTLASVGAVVPRLPNFGLRALTVFAAMLGLLGLLLVACVELAELPPASALLIAVAVAVVQFGLGPVLMDWSLRLFYSLRWVTPEELPAHLRRAIQRIADREEIPFPRMGIIEDGGPNAFTYGHTPRNARIVITRGLFDLLEEDELEGVVAHELGHAVRWDMLVMTAASLVPIICYYLYRTLIRIRIRGKDKTAGARLAIAVVAYIVYLTTQYLVLWLSRIREYGADRYAGKVTGKPNALARALVKIGYGLAGQKVGVREGARQPEVGRRPALEAMGALGIFDAKAGRALAIASQGSGGLSAENLKGAMRWDLWNPWAAYYEIHSTHPLISKRLDHLGRQAVARGEEPLVVMDERKPESYWDEFLVDVFFAALPFLLGAGMLAAGIGLGDRQLMLAAITAAGAGAFVRTLFSYPAGPFPRLNVAGLLKHVKVSAVRGLPCTLRVKVIGRGVPGLVWSEDFVAGDETGIIFLDYRQPLGVVEWLFGLFRRGAYDGQTVTVSGWYRRAPVPFVEIRSIISEGGMIRRCYSYHAKLVLSAALAALGTILMFQ